MFLNDLKTLTDSFKGGTLQAVHRSKLQRTCPNVSLASDWFGKRCGLLVTGRLGTQMWKYCYSTALKTSSLLGCAWLAFCLEQTYQAFPSSLSSPGRRLVSAAGKRKSTSNVWRTVWRCWKTKTRPWLKSWKHWRTFTATRPSSGGCLWWRAEDGTGHKQLQQHL